MMVMPLRRFAADLVFDNYNDALNALDAFHEMGFDAVINDEVDQYSSSAFVDVVLVSSRDEDELCAELDAIVSTFDGIWVEAGYEATYQKGEST